ncbi:MAG: YgfZ/GcvT domain-containing protein [Microthrixaceae bacterium]
MNESAQTAAPIAAPWPRDVLSVGGPDAIKFLQGQLSADIEGLEVGQSATALLLEPTGKLGWVLRVWRTDEHIAFIDTDAGAGTDIAGRLNRFLLRTDAEIELLDWECIAVRGVGSHGLDVDDTGAVLAGVGLWPAVEGIDLLGPSVSPPPHVRVVEAEELEAVRIRSGWPTHGAELADGVIPAEVGQWLIDSAVSFTKGCYVGQELTARIDSRGGNAPRRLVVVDSETPAEAGSDLLADGEVVGAVTSAAVDPGTGATVALGFVKRSVDDDAALSVGT